MYSREPSKPLKEAMEKLGRILGYTGNYHNGRGQHYYGAFPDNIHEFGDLLAVYLQSQPSVNSLTKPPTGFDNLEIGKLYLWYNAGPEEIRTQYGVSQHSIDFDDDGWADYPLMLYYPYTMGVSSERYIYGIYMRIYPERWDVNKTSLRRKKYISDGRNIALFINDNYRLTEKQYIEGNNLFVEINPIPIFLNWIDDSPLFVEVDK